MTFRPATRADSNLLYGWRAAAEDAPWWNGRPVTKLAHEQWFQDRLASRAVRIWIAEDDGEPVGHARLDSNGELSVEIVPERRGEGRGTKLIVATSHLGVEQLGHTRIKACVDESNASARKAFLNAGFEERPDVRFFLWRP